MFLNILNLFFSSKNKRNQNQKTLLKIVLMNIQLISDSEYQYKQNYTNNSTSLINNSGSESFTNSPALAKKVNLKQKNSFCWDQFPKILVVSLWLICLASLTTIIYLYVQKKRFLLKKMQILYLMGIIIISLMDICIGLIALLFLCSSFRFKQVLIFINILKVVGFSMVIFDYDEIEDKIKGDSPDFFLINIYLESLSSLNSFILLFYFIFAYFKNH